MLNCTIDMSSSNGAFDSINDRKVKLKYRASIALAPSYEELALLVVFYRSSSKMMSRLPN
jgi:hypothetical protein